MAVLSIKILKVEQIVHFFSQNDLVKYPNQPRQSIDDMNSPQIEVEPTRIGGLGVGTFLILGGGILSTLLCLAGTAMKRPCRLYLVITLVYASLVLFLINAKRRSRWVVPENVVSDVDDSWLTHILVGAVVVVGSFVGLVTWIWFDCFSVIEAKEIETEGDRRRNRFGPPRFLF